MEEYNKEIMSLVPNVEETSNELLDAQAHVWNHMFKFIHTMSLKCATDLQIPNMIHNHGKPMSLSQLVAALPVDQAKSHHISRLMGLLVHSKFFIKHEEGYWLTPASRLLLKDQPFCLTPLIQAVVDPIMQAPWHFLSEWLSGDDHHHTAFEVAHGMVFWEYAERVPRLNHLFNEAMACDSELVNHVVLSNYRDAFEGFESVVDVGGGTGAMTRALAGAFPEMRCVVLDLPHVVAGLEGTNNLTYVGGDMFHDIPHADLVLLKWILHDWSDEDSVRILTKCKEAIGGSKEKGGKVIVIDMILNKYGGGGDDDKALLMEDQKLYDMAMVTYLNGKERSEQEWGSIFSAAGFNGYKISLGLGVRSLIEVYP